MGTAATIAEANSPRRRRRWQFSIRTMLGVTTIVAVLLGLHVSRMKKAEAQKRLITELRAGGAYCQYEHVQDKNWNPGRKWYPEWLERRAGEDYLYSIDSVLLPQIDANKLTAKVAGFPNLRLVKFPGCTISNESLRPLQKLKRLEWLEMFITPISDEGVAIVSAIKSLKTLDLRGTKVTDACVPDIISLHNLEALRIGNTAISAAGVARISAALPNCQVDTVTQ